MFSQYWAGSLMERPVALQTVTASKTSVEVLFVRRRSCSLGELKGICRARQRGAGETMGIGKRKQQGHVGRTVQAGNTHHNVTRSSRKPGIRRTPNPGIE